MKHTADRTNPALRKRWMVLLIVALAVNVGRAEEPSSIQISRTIDQRLGIDGADESRFTTNPEFLRRLTLDLAGRIPSIAEIQD